MQNNFCNISEKLKNEITALYREIFGDDESFTDILLRGVFEGRTAYAVGEDGKAIGIGFYRLKKMRIFDSVVEFPYIFGIGTAETERGKGVATKIVSDLIAILRVKYPFVMLCPETDSLYGFYEKFGFRVFDYKIAECETENYTTAECGTTNYTTSESGTINGTIAECKTTNDTTADCGTAEILLDISVDKSLHSYSIPKMESGKGNQYDIITQKVNNNGESEAIYYKKVDSIDLSAMSALTDIFNKFNEKYQLAQYRAEEDMTARINEALIGGGRVEHILHGDRLIGYCIFEDGILLEKIMTVKEKDTKLVFQNLCHINNTTIVGDTITQDNENNIAGKNHADIQSETDIGYDDMTAENKEDKQNNKEIDTGKYGSNNEYDIVKNTMLLVLNDIEFSRLCRGQNYRDLSAAFYDKF